MMKMLRILTINFIALVSVWVMAHARGAQQIYPLPVTETEDIVVQWFQRSGYHLRRSIMESHGVRLFAQKENRSWQVTLQPHSPLATRVGALTTLNGAADSYGLQSLWSLLANHMKAITDPAPNDRRIIPDVVLAKADSVVCIYVEYPEKPLQLSGFIIDKRGLIVCTAHGLKKLNQSLTVTLRDGRELPGRVVKIDKRYDLTLVDVQAELDDPIILSDGRDLAGRTEGLFNVVCASQSSDYIFSGVVSGPPRKTKGQLLWQVNMQIRPGSSGSPVFDDKGDLVAVVKGRYRGADSVGFLIPFASLMKFMGDYSK